MVAMRGRPLGRIAAAVAVVAIWINLGVFALSMVQSLPQESFETEFYAQTELRDVMDRELGDDERVVVKEETPRKELRRKARMAARYCPNHVISIEDL